MNFGFASKNWKQIIFGQIPIHLPNPGWIRILLMPQLPETRPDYLPLKLTFVFSPSLIKLVGVCMGLSIFPTFQN